MLSSEKCIKSLLLVKTDILDEIGLFYVATRLK